MAAHKFKTPSSARRHIKIEQFSQFVSATRLRHVQNILANRKAGSADIDGILCISGIDSRYNEGMYELLNYLLFGFFEARKEELESSGFAEEVIEDLMILICSDRVEVYCNPVNYHYFLPYVSHWPGLVFHCLTEDEYNREDDDTVEEFKIRSLIAMVGSFKVIGLPFSGRGQEAPFNVMAIEKWPIIQAFALDDFGGGGFFSLKFEVIDISSQVHLQDFQDPVSVEHLLTEHFSLMARQWDNMMKCVQLSLESSSSVLSQKKVTEPIRSYFLHGLVGHKGNVGKVPFVVFSPDSHRQHMQELKEGKNVQLSDLSLKCDRPRHMICQVASPHNPLACTRTYFFCNEPYIITKGGSGDGLQHSHKNTFLRYTVQIYLSMIKSVLAAIQVYACTASVTKAKSTCLETLQERIISLESGSLANYIKNSINIEFVLVALSINHREESLVDGEPNRKMKYISLTLLDVPAPDDSSSIGSMMFAESFLDSSISIAGSSESSSEVFIATSCIPRYQLWSMNGFFRNQKTSSPSLSSAQWGEKLMTQGDIYMTGTWTALLPPEKVVLTLWEHGFSVQSGDYGAFTLHGSDIRSVSLYDGDSMTQVTVLILEVTMTSVMCDAIPPHLYTDTDERGVSRILFAFNPHTKAHTQLYGNVLPAWKTDSQVPEVIRLKNLDPQIQEIHTYLQSLVDSSMHGALTSLKKLSNSMPNLYRFLDHLTESCGLHGPVTTDVYNSLQGISPTQKKMNDDKITVTVITGAPGSDKEALANILTTYNKHVLNWLVYRQIEECQVNTAALHQFLTNAAHSQSQWLLSKSVRIIIIAPGFCDTPEILRAICSHPDHKLRTLFVVGSVTLCIDPSNAFLEHKMSLPMLTAQCAQGWVNNIVFTSQTLAPSPLLDELQTLIRSINSDVALLKAEKGLVTRSTDLDLIMSEKSFHEPEMERARVLLKPSWREGYPHAWPCHPEMTDIILHFVLPLEKHLTLIKLTNLKKTMKSYPFKGNIYHVHGRLKFNGSGTWFEIEFTPLSGKLVLNDEDVEKSAEFFMCFTGIGLSVEELKQLLNGCIKQKPDKKKFITREDLTPQEIDKIHKNHHLDGLPEGWYYNGSQFVSMDGERSYKHPNLEKFIQDYIDKKNLDISKYNSRVESETYLSLWH